METVNKQPNSTTYGSAGVFRALNLKYNFRKWKLSYRCLFHFGRNEYLTQHISSANRTLDILGHESNDRSRNNAHDNYFFTTEVFDFVALSYQPKELLGQQRESASWAETSGNQLTHVLHLVILRASSCIVVEREMFPWVRKSVAFSQ